MSLPELFQLERAVKKIVRRTKKKGQLGALTPRIIRQEVQKLFSLDDGALDAKVYKIAFKQATTEAMGSDYETDASDTSREDNNAKKRKPTEKVEVQNVTKKAKVASTSKSTTAKKPEAPAQKKRTTKDSKAYKSSSMAQSSDVEEGGDIIPVKQAVVSSDYENDTSPGERKAKKRKPAEQPEVQNEGKKAKVQKSVTSKKKRVTKDSQSYKSSAIVPSSDVEVGDDLENQSPSTTHDVKVVISPADSDDTAKVQGSQKAANKPSSSKVHSINVISEVSTEGNAYKSESELSVLIDEPPKRSKKSKTKDKESGKKKETRQKKQTKSAVTFSKDEEALKRLKSIVVACGVRKVWKKEFQDLDTPSQQIKRVKDILTNLGMSGRFSLEQARAIKEKRELAQELEDVQSFEKTVVSGQSNRSKAEQTHEESASDDDEDDSEKGEVSTKRRNTARLSIMAFLGDQSSED